MVVVILKVKIKGMTIGLAIVHTIIKKKRWRNL